MDTKRLITAIILATVLILGWQFSVAYLDRKYPHWGLLNHTPATQPAAGRPEAPSAPVDMSSQPSTVAPPASPTPSTPTTPPAAPNALGQAIQSSAGQNPARPSISSAGLSAVSALPTQVVLGSAEPKNPDFALAVELSSRGAGISSVALNGYTLRVGKADPFLFQTPYPTDPDGTRPLATRALFIDGQRFDTSSLDFAVKESSSSAVTFAATIQRGGLPILELRKIYTLQRRAHGSLGYELDINYVLRNLTDAPLGVEAVINGPVTPPLEQERGMERHAVAGLFDTENAAVVVEAPFVENFTKDKPTLELTKPDKKLMWFGANGAYFNAILRLDPATVQGATAPDMRAPSNYLARAEARLLNPSAASAHMHEVATQFRTLPLSIAPGAEQSLPMRLYVGPKQRQVLESTYYAALPFQYDTTLVVTSGLCALCTFQWLIKLLVGMLGVFHYLTGDWGVAIIILVLVVRAILHPVTKKSQVSMAKMGKLGPEFERLKKKYGDDKEGFQRAQMQLMKESGYGSTMLLGCVPMLLQMPIWLALWAALQSTFELRQAPFFYGLTWINDLSRPDHLIEFANPIRLPLGFVITGLNILPFLLAVVFWFQHKMMPKPPTTSPEQAQQAKMMQWMTLLFPVFLYSGPSGLNIYILTSTAFGILESKIIRDHLKRQEAAEAEGKVIVDATPIRSSRGKEPPTPTKPKTGLAGWLENLQKQADDVKRQMEQKKKNQ
jgi:YidC/Oxa1 family membrane protein insertase